MLFDWWLLYRTYSRVAIFITGMARGEEPLLKQLLVRSRALQPPAARDPSLSPKGAVRAQIRSSSQPPPGSPNTQTAASTGIYTLQFLPFNGNNVVFKSPISSPPVMLQQQQQQGISISQPDLTKISQSPPTYSPPTLSRCHSPLPQSRCGSPGPPGTPPLTLTRPGTPVLHPHQQPDLISSIYTAPQDVYRHFQFPTDGIKQQQLHPPQSSTFSVSPTPQQDEGGWYGFRDSPATPTTPPVFFTYSPPPQQQSQQQQFLQPPMQQHPYPSPPQQQQNQSLSVRTSTSCQMCNLFMGGTANSVPQKQLFRQPQQQQQQQQQHNPKLTFLPCPLCPPSPAVLEQMPGRNNTQRIEEEEEEEEEEGDPGQWPLRGEGPTLLLQANTNNNSSTCNNSLDEEIG